jgi:formamidopyrimidine-DNA glycosylase
MPELPEVETIKRDLTKKIIHKKIVDVAVLDHRVIKHLSPRQFTQNLKGKTFSDIVRRGKAIVFAFTDPGYLVIQLMMTGQLIYGKALTKAKVRIHLSNGNCLNYNDQRLFGRLHFVRDLNALKYFQSLGPDPLGDGFHADWLKAALAARKSPIKSLLMNQSFMAGIGNIYACEILFGSAIHPQRSADTLKPEEIESLYRVTLSTLKEALRFRGTSMNTYRDLNGEKGRFTRRLKVYGREDEPCVQCQTPIGRIVQAGRSSFFCKRCQPLAN